MDDFFYFAGIFFMILFFGELKWRGLIMGKSSRGWVIANIFQISLHFSMVF
jgi:hypothetical protein